MRRTAIIWGALLFGIVAAACGDNGNTIASEDGTGGTGGPADEGSGGDAAATTGGTADEGSGGAAGAVGGAAGTGGAEPETGGVTGGSGGSGGSAGGLGGVGGDAGGTGGSTGGAAGSGGLAGAGTGGEGGAGGTGGVSTGGVSTGGAGGTGGSADGGAGGTGGECPPLLSCNWCDGEPVRRSDGCITGWICLNGDDPCSDPGCIDDEDCEADEYCGAENLCWPTAEAVLGLGVFDIVPNPCTTDPCLPGEVAAITDSGTTYIVSIDGHWVDGTYDWETEWNFNGLPTQTVTATGVITYHTDNRGITYLEIELSDIQYRVM